MYLSKCITSTVDGCCMNEFLWDHRPMYISISNGAMLTQCVLFEEFLDTLV